MSRYALKPSLADAREHALSALCAYDRFGKFVDNLSFDRHTLEGCLMWGTKYLIRFRLFKDDVIILEVFK